MPKVNCRPRFWVKGAANIFNGISMPFSESNIACGQPHMWKDTSVFCRSPILNAWKDKVQRIHLVLLYNQCTSFFMPYDLITVIF